MLTVKYKGFSGGSEVKASASNVGDLGSIPESGSSPGVGNGSPLQYSCLENPMDGGAWQATPHGFAKSQTWLKWLGMHTQIYCLRTWWICFQFIIILGCRIHAVVWQLKKTKSKLFIYMFSLIWTSLLIVLCSYARYFDGNSKKYKESGTL